jgi:predicted RND superfamily exporter protein
MKIKTILDDYKNSSNKDLASAMDLLNEDFEKTKELIIKLSRYLDFVEESYTKIHTEYMNRNQT